MAVFIVLAMRTSDFIKYDRWFLAAEYWYSCWSVLAI
jgi:hypothetical protein